MTYNGPRNREGRHRTAKNWEHWNVSLWLFNTEYLYRLVREYVRRSPTKDEAAKHILRHLQRETSANDKHPVTTPDGAPYTLASIRAALGE